MSGAAELEAISKAARSYLFDGYLLYAKLTTDLLV